MKKGILLPVALILALGILADRPARAGGGETGIKTFPSLEALEREEERLLRKGGEVRRIEIDDPKLLAEQRDICREVLGDEWRTVGCLGYICLCVRNPFR